MSILARLTQMPTQPSTRRRLTRCDLAQQASLNTMCAIHLCMHGACVQDVFGAYRRRISVCMYALRMLVGGQRTSGRDFQRVL
jgi:hypothetical protein